MVRRWIKSSGTSGSEHSQGRDERSHARINLLDDGRVVNERRTAFSRCGRQEPVKSRMLET